MRDRLKQIHPLIWLLFIALAMRLGVFVIIYSSGTGTASHVFSNSDSAEYTQLAQNIVGHGVFSQQESEPFTPDISRTPGYPLFLAGLYVLAGYKHDPLLIVSAQIALSLASLWLTVKLGEHLVTYRVGLLAGAFYALAPASLIYVGLALSETLFTFLLLCGLFLFLTSLRSSEKRGWERILTAGMCFALAAYTRPIALYFLPLLLLGVLLWRWREKRVWRVAGVTLAVYLLAIMPWFLRSVYHFGTPVFSSIGDGNLLIYNVASVEAHRQHITWREAKDQLWGEVHKRMAENKSLNDAERSRLMRSIALEHIVAHPLEALLYQSLDALNTLRPGYSMSALLLHGTGELGQSIQSGDWQSLLRSPWEDRLVFLWITLYYVAFYFASGVGIVLSMVRRQWELLLMCGVAVGWFMYAPGVAGNARFRAPVEGLLAIFAAVGAVWLWTQVRGAKRDAIWQKTKGFR